MSTESYLVYVDDAPFAGIGVLIQKVLLFHALFICCVIHGGEINLPFGVTRRTHNLANADSQNAIKSWNDKKSFEALPRCFWL